MERALMIDHLGHPLFLSLWGAVDVIKSLKEIKITILLGIFFLGLGNYFDIKQIVQYIVPYFYI